LSRVTMEQIEGRKLETIEHVHHKDFNKSNDNPDNLQVMINKDHLRYHSIQRNYSKHWEYEMARIASMDTR
jgi:hypothetical protein